MKFDLRNILKMTVGFILVTALCISSVGFASLADHKASNEMGDINAVDGVVDSDDYLSVATVSNTVMVTTSEELVDAVAMADDGEVIKITNDIYLKDTLTINKSITLESANVGQTIKILAANDSRHFLVIGEEIVLSAKQVVLDGNQLGGGISNYANDLTLTGMQISNCASAVDGGGIESYGAHIELNNVYISHCNSKANGGAVYANGNVKVKNSKISNNKAMIDGGGIFIDLIEELTIDGMTAFYNNSANQAVQLEDEYYIALHEELIGSDVVWSEGFEYLYNNVDVNIMELLNPIQVSHTVTIVTHYSDGVQTDEVKTYQVDSGTSFIESYQVLAGYQLTGVSMDSGYSGVDSNAQTISIGRVNQDYLITIELAKKTVDVKVTIKYADGILPDETTSYSVSQGEDFVASYEALDGYAFLGKNLRFFPYVDGANQMVYMDNVMENYYIVIRLDKVDN